MKKNSNNKSEKNYVKNYIILLFLFAICIGFTLYLCRWYSVYREYKNDIPVIRGTLSEITPDELDHYVIDNSSVLIYLCTSNSNECRTFEKKLKKYVLRKELSEKIIYLNLTGVNQEDFIKSINDKYNLNKNLTSNYPAFILFKEGNVEVLLQGDSKKALTISKLDSFIELNEYDVKGD